MTALLVQGELYERAKDVDKAAQSYEEAAAMAPADPRAIASLGWLAHTHGQHERAGRLLKQSAEALPDDPRAQFRLGLAARALGDTAGARTAFNRALRSQVVFADRDAARQALASLK